MKITEQAIDQAYSDLKSKCGGVRNDYFAILYLENEFRLPREEAINQVAFGGNDYGVDGFFFDRDRRNFYLFQFKYTEDQTQFKGSLERLINAGMERVFWARQQDASQNDLLLQMGSCLLENQAIIDKIYVHFVFMGDPEKAENSTVLEKLREDLENKKHLVDKYFERTINLVIEFRSAKTMKAGFISHQRTTRTYSVELAESMSSQGANGESMLIGFIRLTDLQAMYKEMGQRFFERNIRASLPEDGAVNRALSRAFKRVIIDGADDPAIFIFNHNGVALAAEKVEKQGSIYKITEPRLLNGAQTITTFARFLEANIDHPGLKTGHERKDRLRVICKIITEAQQEFVTTVTINNNRQNPIESWNLHANDMIQLELQDKFRDELRVYYERQEDAFEGLSDEEREDTGIIEKKPITLLKLTQTFLVTDGEIDKISWMRKVFEENKIYEQVFNESRLKADSRKILLCYKIQFRLRRLINDLINKGPQKYGYLVRARPLLWALLCQGILNDKNLNKIAEDYGKDMPIPANFTEYLSGLSTTRCRFLISDLANQKDNVDKIAESKFGFLRANTAYKKCMEAAYNRWHWTEKRLR